MSKRLKKRKYWVRYPRNLANEYDLCYTIGEQEDDQAQSEGYEWIDIYEARRLCAEENRRRREDPNNSGFGDNQIMRLRDKRLFPDVLNSIEKGDLYVEYTYFVVSKYDGDQN